MSAEMIALNERLADDRTGRCRTPRKPEVLHCPHQLKVSLSCDGCIIENSIAYGSLFTSLCLHLQRLGARKIDPRLSRRSSPRELFKRVSLRSPKPAGLKDDLRLGVADDIASELLAFYDQTCIADAGRDVLICHVASDERTAFALENRFATTSWLCAKSQPKLNQTL